jgi:hypothetical protein
MITPCKYSEVLLLKLLLMAVMPIVSLCTSVPVLKIDLEPFSRCP